MTVDITFQRLARTAFPLVICAIALLYFGVHAVNGDSGLRAWFDVTEKIEKIEAELSVTRAERLRLEHKVNLFRGKRIDPDLLDETARHSLGLSHPDDVIILLDE